MKTGFIYRSLLLAAIAVACFACMSAPYDMPLPPNQNKEVYVDVELGGQVVYLVEGVDEQGEPVTQEVPIGNIAVLLIYGGGEVYTNPNGIFFIERENVYIGNRIDGLWLDVQFTDPDGRANGGTFKAKTVSEPIEVLIENRPLQVNLKVVLEKEYPTLDLLL